MAVRSFFALDVDESVREGLTEAQRALADCGATFRPVTSANLHVTLQFLGDVADDRLGEVLKAAGGAAAEIEPFDFTVAGLLAVPPRGQLRMVWATAQDPTGRMKQLQQRLAEAMEGLGFRPEERSFNPHITLVRIKFADAPARFRQSVQQMAGRNFGLQHAQELVAYGSQLTPTGPVYTLLSRMTLGR
jgi:2'-5' RNA ligase